jgi:hypothetical protein
LNGQLNRNKGKSSADQSGLFQFNLSTGGFQLFFHFLRLFLAHTLFDRFGSFIDQRFGILQSKPGDGSDFLDDTDFLVTGGQQDDVNSVFSSAGAAASAPGAAAIMATGAAAETPNFSSICLTISESSSTDILAINSITSSLVRSAI